MGQVTRYEFTMLTISDENDLLSALHDGLYEQPPWATFLERVRTRTMADSAALIIEPADSRDAPPRIWVAHHSSPTGLEDAYRALFPGGEEMLAAIRDGRVYAGRELFAPGRDLYLSAEIWDRYEFGDMRIVRVTEPGGAAAILAINRQRREFRSVDGAVLVGLADHLRRALRHRAELDRQQHRNAVAGASLQRLDLGWITLDRLGRLIVASDIVERFLARDRGLRVAANGRLFATDPSVDRSFGNALQRLIADSDAQPHALRLSDDPPVDLLLLPYASAPADKAEPGPVSLREPAMIVYLRTGDQAGRDRHAQIAELFGLLRSEARLAMALCQGLTLAEAADHLAITIETARNYSKKIYAKTGAWGQADLVRRILSSMATLG